MPFVGGRITAVSAKRMKDGDPGMPEIKLGIKELDVDKTKITVKYEYHAKYGDIAELTVEGELLAEETKDLAKAIADSKKNKSKLPEEFAERLLNNINYAGSVNGVFIARVLNLTPPMMPPRMKIGKQPEGKVS